MTDLNLDAADWRQILDAVDAEEPPTLEVADAVAGAFDLATTDAQDAVYGAVDDGVLVETDAGALGGIRLADEPPEPSDSGDIEGRGSGSSTDDHQGETDETAEDDAVDALADALDWFAQQLDTDLPDDVDHDTAREYFRARGWSDETIREKRLGYAPADTKDRLLAYLHRRGFDRETILATGLFREWDGGGLSATWTGRYVLPYFDRDGRPVFAISRATDPAHPSDWAGRYDTDDDPAKYHKLPVSRDAVAVEEPIYGLDTVEPGEPVLITEGIADAITAHQAGYACVSPVTTAFKTSDRERLVDALDAAGVPRVYIVQDAERPTSDTVEDREGWDALTVAQHGEGVKGAVRTAAYLSTNGIDARVGDLPRPGLDKVDLDDYLTEWDGDLRPILAGAAPAEHHPAYDPNSGRTGDDGNRDTSGAEKTGGSTSALFDLDLVEVAGVDCGERTTNPLGHHGDSENYYVVDGDGETAYDHKYKTTYNAVTHLLVAANERTADDPEGDLDDEEIFAAWKHAKEQRHLDDDDPIPRRALQHVAREHTEWDGDLVEQSTADGDTFDALPTDVYADALDAVREEYGVDPGRRRPSGRADPDADPVAALPTGALDALDEDERARFLRKRGVEIPSTDEVRRRLRDTVVRELRAGNNTVVDAPTGSGKTYTSATEPWHRRADITGESPVVHLHATTDARDEAYTESRDATGVDAAVLKGRREISPLARGDHDPVEDPDADAEEPDIVVTIDGEPASEWFDRMCDERGLPFSTALALARDRNDQGLDDLPPVGKEDPAVEQWDGLPRDDDGEPAKDVIHATHQFAYVPSLRSHTNVILDEQPDYRVDLSQDRVRRMVNAYLRTLDAPVSTWEAFVSLARFDGDGRSDAQAERDALDDLLGADPTREWYVEDPDAHALAPDLTRAIWNALRWEDTDANGRRGSKVFHEPPRFDADETGYNAGTWLSVVVDDENTVRRVRSTPDFSQARAVVGLDAHPSMPMWQLNAGPGFTRDAVLEPTERRLWRRYGRGLTVVQVGDAARPRSGPDAREWMNDERIRAILDRLREHYGHGFKTALSTKQTEPQLRQLLADVAGDAVDRDSTMHYGEEKSRNDFAGERAGYVYGCMDPGDGMILDALAELDLDATPSTVETDDGEEKREKGRTFDGPDADTAREVLASVRENHVAQAAGRYARNADDDSRATVYVDTNAAPTGFVDVEAPGVEWLASDLQTEIIDALADRPSATSREIADAAGCSKEHVRETLGRLVDRDLVARRPGAGGHGADIYTDTGADGALLDLGETANDPLMDSSRWSLAIGDAGDAESGADGSPGSDSPVEEVAADVDPPPDTAD